MVVLAAPDDSALVLVDWWWNMPDVRIRSTMKDGSVVETHRAWDRDLPLPRRLERARPKLDLLGEQTLFGSPRGGRWVVASEGGPAELWEGHRRRVAEWTQRRGTSTVPSMSVEDAVALSSRLAAHGDRVVGRMTRIARVVLLTLIAVPVLILVLIWFGDLLSYAPATVVLAILGINFLTTVVVFPRIIRCRYVERLRPRFAP